MAIDLLKDTGTPPDRQKFDWRDMVRMKTSKLDDDAFTRVRIILMNGIEQEQNRFLHSLARMHRDLRPALAEIRRHEHHQQTLANWLLPPDLSQLETTLAYEQVAVEVTASIADHEQDQYLAQVYRFGLLEDFDHLYRYAALYDRLEGGDANTILQSYTDIRPGRATSIEHRAPEDDLRTGYDRRKIPFASKLHAHTIMAAENQTRDYYMNVGPQFADPLARQLYAEIASIEEQHVTQYESIIDPDETPLEKWMLHEATEVYNYASCVGSESNSEVKRVWERCLDYELGHLRFVAELLKRHEKRDPAEVLAAKLPDLIEFKSHRTGVRTVLQSELDVTTRSTAFIRFNQEPQDAPSPKYRARINSGGSPSDTVATDYQWRPGTELVARVELDQLRQSGVLS